MLGAVTALVAIQVIRALSPRVEALRIDCDGHLTCQAIGESGFVPAHLLPGATAVSYTHLTLPTSDLV